LKSNHIIIVCQLTRQHKIIFPLAPMEQMEQGQEVKAQNRSLASFQNFEF
jgi:hypothetical protein